MHNKSQERATMISLDTLITIALTSTITSAFNAITTFFIYKLFLNKLDRNHKNNKTAK